MKYLYTIFISVFFFLSYALFADSGTASLQITGNITETVTVEIDETSGYDSLDLNDSISSQEIARISINSNAKDGFTLTCTTSNNLNFKGDGTAQQEARYTLKYLSVDGSEKTIGKSDDGADVTYNDGSGAVLEDISMQSAITDSSNRTLKLSYTNADLLWEPNFTDTITLTLTSK
ncbi:MAG: hypothetical protein HOC94_04775 [Waddliaceae bacterium]|nr:hypothetical protein [Waddliaceae bacterium]